MAPDPAQPKGAGQARLLSVFCPKSHTCRGTRRSGWVKVDHRGMLCAGKGRSWARSLRGPFMARLAPAHEPRHDSGCLPGKAVCRPETQRLGKSERNESKQTNRTLTLMENLIPGTAEIRYLIARLILRPPICPEFIIKWSIWRRRHQFKAASAHYRTRLKTQL